MPVDRRFSLRQVFWDGFFWERGAYVATGLGYGNSTFVRSELRAAPSPAARRWACRSCRFLLPTGALPLPSSRSASGLRLTSPYAPSPAQGYFLCSGLGAALGVFVGCAPAAARRPPARHRCPPT